jgi:hypothetical protein
MSKTFTVAGTLASWEQRCLDVLNRRPFRIIGSDEGGPEGREFVAEYRNVAGVVRALVFVDLMPSGDASTTVALRADAHADNPVRALFRDMADKAVKKAETRLVEASRSE